MRGWTLGFGYTVVFISVNRLYCIVMNLCSKASKVWVNRRGEVVVGVKGWNMCSLPLAIDFSIQKSCYHEGMFVQHSSHMRLYRLSLSS